MAISQPKKRILTLAAWVGAVEKTSEEYNPHPAATQTSLLINMSAIGTMDVDMLGTDKAWYEIDTFAVAANTPIKKNYAENFQGIRCRFTPTVGPTTGFVDAAYAGPVGA